MDIYELLKACKISLIEIDGKLEIAEQLTVEDCKDLLKAHQARYSRRTRQCGNKTVII